ncbi:MAG: apolipoprotein N-acyltransferase [Desulfococcaceae bacterium]
MHRYVYPVISGLLLTGAFPRTGLYWLAWFALIPLLWSLRNVSCKESFRLGFIAGLVHYLGLVYWLVYTMQTYGGLPVYLSVPLLFLLAAYLALYPAFFSLLITSAARKPFFLLCLMPFAWVALEYARSHLLSGFPWELLGYSQFRCLHLIQISDITGVYGVSFLLVLINAAVFVLVLYVLKSDWQGERTGKGFTYAVLATALICLGIIAFYGKIRIQTVAELEKTSPVIKAAAVQGNIDQMVKWDPAFQEGSTRKYVELSLSVKENRPDLVVWPETAAPFYFSHNTELTRTVTDGIRQIGAWFLIGSPSWERGEQGADYYNSAYLISPEGEVAGRFDKVHLVPFGEYVPLKKWLPFVKKLVAQVGDFKTGTKGEILSAGRFGMGVLICYEIIFPELSAAAVKNGADLLVNITNDAWYGNSSAPYQHFSMSVFRAVENRRSLVRAANTGISGFVDPAGSILQTTRLFRDAAVTEDLPAINAKTFYTRHGDLFAIICVLTAVFLIILFRNRKEPFKGK